MQCEGAQRKMHAAAAEDLSSAARWQTIGLPHWSLTLSFLIRSLVSVAVAVCLFAGPGAWAMETAVAQVDPAKVSVKRDWWGGMVLRLPLSGPVAYAVGLAEDPLRLELRFPGGLEPGAAAWPEGLTLSQTGAGTVVRMALDRSRVLDTAQIHTDADGATVLEVRLSKASSEAMTREAALWTTRGALPPAVVDKPKDRLLVMIDPGHGGYDPGAERGGVREADLVLAMAQDLATALEHQGIATGFTRRSDEFVSLSDRLARANRSKADVFISLHADALPDGRATGATVHSLPSEADAAGNRFLLSRLGHEALGSTDGVVTDTAAETLIDLSRAPMRQSGARLAKDMVQEIQKAGIALYKTPLKQSNFVVLRGADMASVLVELGYLSEPEDRARLNDPAWRARMAAALASGVRDWAVAQ